MYQRCIRRAASSTAPGQSSNTSTTTPRHRGCRTEGHQPLTIPFADAAAGHLDHAYAMTVLKAQGSTFVQCFVLAGDQPAKEIVDTALPRGHTDNPL